MDITSPIWQKLSDQGVTFLLMGVGLYWMSRIIKDLIKTLHQERTDRILKLEEEVDECKKDRADLRKDHEQLWQKMVSMAAEWGLVSRSKSPEMARLIPGENGR